MRVRFLETVTTGVVVAAAACSANAADTSGSGSTSIGLEEVVVTAQRRGENLQRVPIAVSAATANDLEQKHIESTDSLEFLAPGLKIPNLAGTVSPTIRGVGNLDPSAANSPNVATYVDGIYYPALAGQVFNLAGVERIEILHGPQGTLFGRNATGGAIQVVTKDPEQAPSGMIEVGYANYDTQSASLYGTTGITDNIATAIAASYDHQFEGWGRNLTLDKEVHEQRNLAVRNKWLFDFGDNTRVTLAGDYLEHDEAHVEALAPGYIPVPASTVVQGTIYDTQTGVDFAPAYIRQGGVSLKLEHEFDWAKVVSLSSYRKLRARSGNSLSQSPVSPVVFHSWTEDHHYTEELQLLSSDSSEISWIVGGFFMDRESSYDPFTITGANFNRPPFCFGPGCTGGVTTRDSSRSRSLAGYGQATIPLDSISSALPAETRLTLGARYTVDRISVSGSQNFGFMLATVPPGTDETYERATFRAVLDHQFTPNVMAYVSFNTGFKAGLYNLGNPLQPPTAPEKLEAYEVGIKSDFLNQRLRVNASAFHYDYKDVQLTVVIPTGTQLINAAAAKVDGLDLTIDALATDNLRLSASAAYLQRAKYTSFPAGPTAIPCITFVADPANPGPLCLSYPGGNAQFNADLSGNRMIMTPEVSFTLSASYTIAAFEFNAAYRYQSKMYSTLDNRYPVPDFGLLNLGVNWTSPAEAWEIGMWADNVLDDEYITRINANAYAVGQDAGAPQTYGINITRRF